MEISHEIGGAVILAPDPCRAIDFLRQTFSLEDAAENALRIGNFLLKVCPSDGPMDACRPDDMLLGLRHIALETDDIREALSICRAKGLCLQTAEDDGPRFSGKVYGTGLCYFNILTDFGVTLEITEKHAGSRKGSGRWADGLGHIGIQTADLCKSQAFYERLGFHQDFLPVENPVEGGVVRCCMVSRDNVTLELYEFKNGEKTGLQSKAALSALILPWLPESIQGPDGERLLK